MARLQLLVFAFLALTARSALAAPCVDNATTQSAILKGQNPTNCLNSKTVQEQSPLDQACFNTISISRQSGGATCNNFTVALANATCLEGPVGSGTLTQVKGGGYSANGDFATGQSFTGTQSADNKTLTVSVKGFDCELVYTLRSATNTSAANGSAATTAAQLPGASGSSPPPSAPPPAPPSGPAKGSGIAALPSAVLMLLGAAAALAF